MLFWAVVLLLLCMYLLGVVTKTLFSKYAARRIQTSLVYRGPHAAVLCTVDNGRSRDRVL